MLSLLQSLTGLLHDNTLQAEGHAEVVHLPHRAPHPQPVPAEDNKDEAKAKVNKDKDEDRDFIPHLPITTQAAHNYAKSLNPWSNSTKDDFDMVVKLSSKVKLGTHCSFPSSDGAGFNKDNQLHVAHLRQVHKAVKMAMKLTITTYSRHQVAAEELDDVMSALLYAMRLTLNTRDEIWVHRHHGEEVFNTFNVLENSSLTGNQCQQLIDQVRPEPTPQQGQPFDMQHILVWLWL